MLALDVDRRLVMDVAAILLLDVDARRLAVAIADVVPAADRDVIRTTYARMDRGAAGRVAAALATTHAHGGARSFPAAFTALASFAPLIAGRAHFVAAAVARAAFAATLVRGRAFTALRRTRTTITARRRAAALAA